MDRIIKENPHINYYNFIVNNYTWAWGEVSYFKWKHFDDPLRTEPDFYVIMDGQLIKSLCVGRRLFCNYKSMRYNSIIMMDFVTDKKFRKAGYSSKLSKYITDISDSDIAFGFASIELKNTVHKDKQIYQLFYTYEAECFCKYRVPKCYVIDDRKLISRKLNNHYNALQVNNDEEYIGYIMKCPKYEKIFYVMCNNLLVCIGIKNNSVRVLDMSEFSTASCYLSCCVAAKYGEKVYVDFPHPVYDPELKLKKEEALVVNNINNKLCLLKGDTVWVPVLERK